MLLQLAAFLLALTDDPPRRVSTTPEGVAISAKQFLDTNNPNFLEAENTSFDRGGVHSWQYPGRDIEDVDLGLRPAPNRTVREMKRTQDAIAYDVNYTLDAHGRRDSLQMPKERKKFIVFSGCSFTFGSALPDDQTYPHFFAQNTDEYAVYNYGIPGTGTNTVLALTESEILPREVPQKEGIFIYTFLDFHTDRALGYYPTITWARDLPYFKPGADGRALRDGLFSTRRPWRTLFYTVTGNLFSWVRGVPVIYPSVETKGQEFVCQMVSQARKNFETKFPGSRFYVYSHPLAPTGKFMRDCFREKGISLLEGDPLPTGITRVVPLDFHPSGQLNEFVGRDLMRLLSHLSEHR